MLEALRDKNATLHAALGEVAAQRAATQPDSAARRALEQQIRFFAEQLRASESEAALRPSPPRRARPATAGRPSPRTRTVVPPLALDPVRPATASGPSLPSSIPWDRVAATPREQELLARVVGAARASEPAPLATSTSSSATSSIPSSPVVSPLGSARVLSSRPSTAPTSSGARRLRRPETARSRDSGASSPTSGAHVAAAPEAVAEELRSSVLLLRHADRSLLEDVRAALADEAVELRDHIDFLRACLEEEAASRARARRQLTAAPPSARSSVSSASVDEASSETDSLDDLKRLKARLQAAILERVRLLVRECVLEEEQ